ncbi:formamidopyrimidine-dna glycosylase [Melanomma pulvis-pyrius CBS 109.77]|uniref:Formamidopyrimidine-dna glycosylase n=1 Tax=Melanomma pulvis-pyrius CBS 109.77 TaxID=1314802 RepID=A0A6A6WS52_9PLEO|nr:formamidopyrimidine-dna glycosylase [Melanomma pulvis-pyrius CBS 109.77]
MPEIAEVARIVHFLKKHVVGKTIATVKTQEDDIIYGKVGTSATAFSAALTGKTVVAARQQGKYFWLELSSPPHPLMHFGMSGWMNFSNDSTAYYRPSKPAPTDWPPRFWKFVLQMKEDPTIEVAFVDARRLGRIRLVDVEGEKMRLTSPLKENGPDPVIDKDVLTVEWLAKKLRSKRVPVKALLLDQANISGIGNWVGDEIMYQARLHPEQYSNTFTDAQIAALHKAMMFVCDTAVGVLGDSDQFPEDWLMKHRWGKGKKDGGKLPNGAKITFLKVGGRTSAVVPSVQKKTAAVAGDVEDDGEDEDDDEDVKPKKTPKRKNRAVKEEEEEETKTMTPANTKRGREKVNKDVVKAEDDEEEEEEKVPAAKKPRRTISIARKGSKTEKGPSKSEDSGRRKSGRLSKG